MERSIDFDRLSQGSLETLFHARAAVSDLGGRAVTSDHLFVGLLQTSTEPLKRFVSAPCDLVIMMAEVHDGLRAKASGLVDPAISDNVPLAGDADRILQKAVDEAAASRQERADPEHILLALLTESKGLSVETLQKHGVVTANVRAYLKTREVGR